MKIIGKYNGDLWVDGMYHRRVIELIILHSNRVINKENSLVWHQQVLGWLNQYSGIRTPGAVSLNDTEIPVVDYNPQF